MFKMFEKVVINWYFIVNYFIVSLWKNLGGTFISNLLDYWFSASIFRLICLFTFQFPYSVPTVEIRGAPDIYVMAGSGVALHCVISGLLETPPFVFWYHKTERIAGSALQEPALQQQKSVSSGGSRSASSSLVDASFIPDSINGQHKESFGTVQYNIVYNCSVLIAIPVLNFLLNLHLC